MKLVGRGQLDSFVARHTDARDWIRAWITETEGSTWRGTMDIKQRYSSASFLANNVVIFNVKGNKYRLEVQVAFNSGIVFIKWIGTHAEYDRRHA